MSIYQTIEAAENEAEKIKQEAVEKARELLREAQNNARIEAAAILEEAHKKSDDIRQEAQTTQNAKMEELLRLEMQKNSTEAQQARLHADDAVRYVLERVETR